MHRESVTHSQFPTLTLIIEVSSGAALYTWALLCVEEQSSPAGQALIWSSANTLLTASVTTPAPSHLSVLKVTQRAVANTPPLERREVFCEHQYVAK